MMLFPGVDLQQDADGALRCWLETQHARGWLTPVAAAGTRDGFARQFEAALGAGFVAADAAVLAMTRTCHPQALPLLSWGEQPATAAPASRPGRRLDLYAIVDSAERMEQVLAAGVKTVQLRIKAPERPDAAWSDMLRGEVRRSVAACDEAGAELFVNDHWRLAAEVGARGVHLGQEDVLALGDAGRAELAATGMALGISSHSLWELCRARVLGPRYIACGPVWPTLTKAMPWRPQGLDNLAWWCRMAGAPVVAIGGILEPDKVFEAARCGADGVCIVRGLGEHPRAVVPRLQAALEAGRQAAAGTPLEPSQPHPSLDAEKARG
ncbi:thiamine phosphate synthase [Caenimonas terrae]|uniref:Thiamine phosphate synthase n=1 Tax=Caenimonas terrae TaxID=696074 RepID=A0ABW0NES2_9BURK